MVNNLIKKLSEGEHEVTIGHVNESYEEIKNRIANGYIHIKFLGIQGDTDLGINIDPDRTNVSDINFIEDGGVLHIEGTTNLNYCSVRCIADINLRNKKGVGSLQII